MYVPEEVRHPLGSIRAGQIRPSTQGTARHLLDAFAQYARLVRDRAYHTPTRRTILVVVQMAVLRWMIVRVYPVPLVREVTLAGMRVGVGPGCCAAERAVVLGFEDLGEDGTGLWCEEALCHEDELVVYCFVLAVDADAACHSYHLCSSKLPAQAKLLHTVSVS
jgi:hypothetical protein